MAGLHGDLTLKQDVQVLVDDLVVRQDRVAIIEISFFLVDVPLKDLINLRHLLLILLLHFKLCQVIANLLAIPALCQTDLINDLFALTDQILHFSFGLFLAATADLNWCKAEFVLDGVIVFC